jgi:hypothetical protein
MIGAMAGTGSEGSSAETTYGLIAQLQVVIESYSLEPLVRAFSPAFTRYTTLVRLHGAGEDGLGEDVTPFEPAQHAFASSAAELPLSGFWTIESFAACLDEVELYDGPQLLRASRRHSDGGRWRAQHLISRFVKPVFRSLKRLSVSADR